MQLLSLGFGLLSSTKGAPLRYSSTPAVNYSVNRWRPSFVRVHLAMSTCPPWNGLRRGSKLHMGVTDRSAGKLLTGALCRVNPQEILASGSERIVDRQKG